jgi:hypothetical protein
VDGSKSGAMDLLLLSQNAAAISKSTRFLSVVNYVAVFRIKALLLPST